MVGGSSVAFGIDSQMISNQLEREPINVGVHGGLGLRFYLKLVEPRVQSGDLIVLAPEYNLMSGSIEADIRSVFALFERYPELRPLMNNDSSFSNLKDNLDKNWLWAAHIWTKRAYSRIWNSDTDSGRVKLYDRRNFSAKGDFLGHLNRKPNRKPGDQFIKFREHKADESIELINEFASKCQAKGATVAMIFPPMMERVYSEFESDVEGLAEYYRDQLNLPILNTWEESVFLDEMFFDSPMHLTKHGRKLHSERIAMRLFQFEMGTSQQPAEPETVLR